LQSASHGAGRNSQGIQTMDKKDCCGKCSEQERTAIKSLNEVTGTNAELFNYVEQALLTKSDKFYGQHVSYQHLNEVLGNCMKNLRELDKIKKSLFYGKGQPNFIQDVNDCDCSGTTLYVGYDEQTGQDIIHGILGIATEAGELLELLYATLFEGKSFDAVNLAEENGDIFWYQAVLANAACFTFGECQRKNIAKLRMRFGEKFSEYDAENRNLKAERSILEQDFGNPERTGA
jgi:NTP pyrophosphatase (non-canonical NTP hydrolase)